MGWSFLSKLTVGIMLLLTLLTADVRADYKYQVRQGDTLSAIANKKKISLTALKKINHLKTNSLKERQLLTIPGTEQRTSLSSAEKTKDFYVVKKGDTLAAISAKTGVSIKELSKINKVSVKKRLKIGQKLALRDKAEKDDVISPTESVDVLPTVEELPDNGDRHLLGKWNTSKEPQLLVNVALAFLDAPYRMGGSSVRGIDCSGFVKKIYSLFGIDLPRTAAEQAKVGIAVAKNSLMEGDLIFFRTSKKNRIGHVGIYIGENKFVHAASGTKKVRVDSLDTSYYKNLYKRAIRLKELDNTPSEPASIMTKGDVSPGA